MVSVKTVLAFALGAAAGVASCALYFKNKYEDMYNKDAAALREFYTKEYAQNCSTKEAGKTIIKEPAKSDDTLTAYARKVSDYTSYNPDKHPVQEEPVNPPIDENAAKLEKAGFTDVEKVSFEPMTNPNPNKPYRIDADDFGQDDNFTPVYWCFHTDGILENENGQVITNIIEWVGDALRVFADTDDNLVWVRNEKYGVDIEIARTAVTYEKQCILDGRDPDVVGD